MRDSQPQAPSPFSLQPGERITGCYPLWTGGSDRILQEVANCNYCLERTYRVIIITTTTSLERRAALCVSHYATAARVFPELKRQTA